MQRRQRDLPPWPLATPEQAAHYTIERSRTNAGARLLEQGVALDALPHCVEVRLKQVRIDDTGEASGIVYTRLKDGAWINEGGYVLSRHIASALSQRPPLVRVDAGNPQAGWVGNAHPADL